MPRTGQPAVRHVAAVERAVAVLDALSDGSAELGTNEIARRTGQPAVRHVAAVERALAVLDALSDGHSELGTNEIARRTGINASTVSRLLATLVASGLVEHVSATGRYRLGMRLLQLGNVVAGRLDLREIARPHLR